MISVAAAEAIMNELAATNRRIRLQGFVRGASQARGPQRDAIETWRTATHEAGHALVAELHDHPVYDVTIASDGRTGRTTYAAKFTDAWQKLVITWAGAIAQARDVQAAEEEIGSGQGSDREHVLSCIRALDPEHARLFPDDTLAGHSLDAKAKVLDLLEQHRPAIRKIAGELVHHGSVSGARVREIMQGEQ